MPVPLLFLGLASYRPTRAALAVVVIVWLGIAIILSSAATTHSPRAAATIVWDRLSQYTPTPGSFTLGPVGSGTFVNHGRCSSRHAAALEALDAKWGRTALDMSEGRLGSGLRVRKALGKLINGETMTIGALGGSVTYGHGVLEVGDKPWPIVLGERLQAHWPEATVNMTNGARPATGTNYFAYCYHQHVAEQSDLFILEGAINDITTGKAEDLPATVEETEYLIRALITGNSDAAVMMLTTWSPPWLYISGGDQHASVAEYYDVPRITARAYGYQYLTQQHSDEIFDQYQKPDNSHQNKLGHEYMADILFRYLLKETCRAESDPLELDATTQQQRMSGTAQKSGFDAFALPKTRIAQKWNEKPLVQPGTPWCRSTNKLDEKGQYILQPMENKGFFPHRVYDKEYWRANSVGNTISFGNVTVPEGGNTISIFYHRQHTDKLGVFKCWIDTNKAQATTFVSDWAVSIGIGSRGVIDSKVRPGLHIVTCEIIPNPTEPKNQGIKLIAVMGS